jgi:histidinol dehydrogenase
MTWFLDTAEKDFEAGFSALLSAKREASADVADAVAAIIARVRSGGDAALVELARQFDGVDLDPARLALTADEIAEGAAKVPADIRDALNFAADRIRAFHESQRPEDRRWTDAAGAGLGWRWTPVDRAGLYVPGGQAAYPSTLLMNAIPARVAGVRELVMCTPERGEGISPLVLAAAEIGGVDRIFRIGGAQAIAALAYGTESLPRADKITGPGNAYVAAAKAQVFGAAGIDMIAGPSEVVVIADATARADFAAMDLLAQAEHDASAQSIVIAIGAGTGLAITKAVEDALRSLPRAAIAGASWRDNGAVVTVRSEAEAAELANRLAPEHLELMTADPEALLPRIRHAGAVFLGAFTPEAVGDYTGGPNHVLPTARSARHASGLGVIDFMKRTTIQSLSPSALRALGPATALLARGEGLEAHARAVDLRLASLNERGDG